MKQVTTLANKFVDCLGGAILVLVPFQGFLTVWGSSILGHYTALRLWDDAALFTLSCIACSWVVRDAALRAWFLRSTVVRLIGTFVGLSLLLGIISYLKDAVTIKALAYGVLVDVRFLVWFLVVVLAVQRSTFLPRTWPKLLLLPAAAVVLFAVLQYTVLPHTFLTHFGYNATTIVPIETINHNSHYIRVQSTLRGANPLGAYLVIILSALGVLYMRGTRKLLCVLVALLACIALYASGSRSAWVGTAISLCSLAALQLQSWRTRALFGVVGLGVVCIAAGGYLLLKNNVRLQNEVLHTQHNSVVKTTSDGAHASALRTGITDVLQQPLGDGPGTAGPASVYNGSHPARIAEDYYVQVAQEVGWLGLALFLSILVCVCASLYRQIATSRLALVMFASFFGIAFVNLLSHAWADDTLAFVWWGLAGIVVGREVQEET